MYKQQAGQIKVWANLNAKSAAFKARDHYPSRFDLVERKRSNAVEKKKKKNRNGENVSVENLSCSSFERALSMSDKLRDFKDLKLIGKGSFGRVYRAVRYSDGQE